jgi:DNA-binding MarR family transcriptional regulator
MVSDTTVATVARFQVLKKAGVNSISSATVLLLTAKQKNASLTMLSRQIGHTTAAITGVVDALERAGLVTRVTSCCDRRVTLLALTQKGEAVIAEFYEDTTIA